MWPVLPLVISCVPSVGVALVVIVPIIVFVATIAIVLAIVVTAAIVIVTHVVVITIVVVLPIAVVVPIPVGGLWPIAVPRSWSGVCLGYGCLWFNLPNGRGISVE